MDVHKQRHASYQKVCDARKRPIRGLWLRHGRYYARLAIEDTATGGKQTRRVPLEGVSTVAPAAAELRRLQTQRETNELPVTKRTPKFCDYVKEYFACFELVKDAKREATLETERAPLNQWVAHLGETRLDRINQATVNGFIARRQGEGVRGERLISA